MLVDSLHLRKSRKPTPLSLAQVVGRLSWCLPSSAQIVEIYGSVCFFYFFFSRLEMAPSPKKIVCTPSSLLLFSALLLADSRAIRFLTGGKRQAESVLSLVTTSLWSIHVSPYLGMRRVGNTMGSCGLGDTGCWVTSSGIRHCCPDFSRYAANCRGRQCSWIALTNRSTNPETTFQAG
jgi:hypothetical protein